MWKTGKTGPQLEPDDKKFALKLMKLFNVPKLRFEWSLSTKRWPDIWVTLNDVPVITVTQEWARQTKDERRKRLVHEFLHISRFDHNEKIGYSTYPEEDTFSRQLYNVIKKL